MTTTTTGRATFRDGPDATIDAADILYVVPSGTGAELRPGPGGTLLLVRTTDAQSDRAALERANRAGLERVARGGGAKP